MCGPISPVAAARSVTSFAGEAGVFTDQAMATQQPARRFSFNSRIAYPYVDARLDQPRSPYGLK